MEDPRRAKCQTGKRDKIESMYKDPTRFKQKLSLVYLWLVPLVTAAMIRSKKELEKIAAMYNSPLSKLSTKDLAEFESKLVERQGVGIVSLRYDKVQKLLSEKDFYQLMTMFGLDLKNGYWGLSTNPNVIKQIRGSSQMTALFEGGGTDYKGYYCHHPNSCAQQSYISRFKTEHALYRNRTIKNIIYF